jgi:uncharacterized protein YbjT (DUF2867 family)
MILVTGGTGTVGSAVVAQLLQAGQAVRVMTRNPSNARLGDNVEVVAGDLRKPETLTSAVDGIERVFSVALGPQLGAQEANLARAARRAGVRQIVKPVLGAGKIAYIHPGDVAAVAVRALTEPGHEEKAYALTGPEALSMAQQVHVLEGVAGRSIEVVEVSDEVARERMQDAGMPAYLIDALLPFAAVVRSGMEQQLLPAVEQLTESAAHLRAMGNRARRSISRNAAMAVRTRVVRSPNRGVDQCLGGPGCCLHRVPLAQHARRGVCAIDKHQ